MNPKVAADPNQATAPRRRRRILLSVFLLVLVVGVKFGYDYYRNQADEADLQAAIADTDRLDPGWRLADLEERRAEVPPDRDAAPLVSKAGSSAIAILNTKNVRADLVAISAELKKLSPTVPLTPQQTEALRASLAPLAGPLADARRIAEFPEGRYPFDSSPEQIGRMPHIDNSTITMWLLRSDAYLQAQDGDLDGAWADCQAIFQVARAFGDEPSLVQTCRAYDAVFALQAMERTLAQGQVSDAALARTQTLLKNETDHPRLLIALRSRRAYLHYVYTQYQKGVFSQALDRRFAGPGGYQSHPFLDSVQDYLTRREVRPTHAWLLRYYNQAVEIAKQRGDDAPDDLRQLQANAGAAPPSASKLADFRFHLRFLDPKKNRAQFDCARTALAVERFRLKHQRWPKALADLTAEGLLAEVPNDPFDGKPLRYRDTPEGVVVYSIGPNRDGTGIGIDRDLERDFDQQLYFRLWNVERRRRHP